MQREHRMTIQQATLAAKELKDLLYNTLAWPCFSDFVVAGSVRRKRRDPADVELVIRPCITRAADLWGYGKINVLNEFDEACSILMRDGRLEKRLDKNGRGAWGERMKRGVFITGNGVAVPVDIFSVIEPATWGALLAIRTGPGDFNKLLVTSRAFGGACPRNCKVAGMRVWNLDKLSSRQREEAWRLPASKFVKRAVSLTSLETETEEQFFDALRVPLWEPADRTLERLTGWLGK